MVDFGKGDDAMHSLASCTWADGHRSMDIGGKTPGGIVNLTEDVAVSEKGNG